MFLKHVNLYPFQVRESPSQNLMVWLLEHPIAITLNWNVNHMECQNIKWERPSDSRKGEWGGVENITWENIYV